MSTAVWSVIFDERFEPEFDAWPLRVRRELLTKLRLLAVVGPSLGRPQVDTLEGSAYANMKEFRFSADAGAWRVAFAFDPARKAILLVGGDKSGMSSRRFYASLLDRADERYAEHLASMRPPKPTRYIE